MTYLSAGRAYRQPLLLAAAILLLAAFTPGCKMNPVTGQQQLNFISREQALALGDEQHSSVVRTYNGTMDMPELNAYLTHIVLRIHKNSHTPNMQVDFTLLNSSVVNAFALPGHVYATRGFVAKVENEAQFASVMGHELAHVSAGHVAQQMSRQTLSKLGLAMAGIALGTDTLASRGALQAARLGTGLLNLSYSRDQERQADRAGTYYTALSGWDPQAALQMQKLIHDIEEKQQSALAKYLSTHPPLSERLDAIKSVINEKNLGRYVENGGLFKKRWQQRTAEMRKIHKAYQPYDEGEKALQDDRPREALEKAR